MIPFRVAELVLFVIGPFVGEMHYLLTNLALQPLGYEGALHRVVALCEGSRIDRALLVVCEKFDQIACMDVKGLNLGVPLKSRGRSRR